MILIMYNRYAILIVQYIFFIESFSNMNAECEVRGKESHRTFIFHQLAKSFSFLVFKKAFKIFANILKFSVQVLIKGGKSLCVIKP